MRWTFLYKRESLGTNSQPAPQWSFFFFFVLVTCAREELCTTREGTGFGFNGGGGGKRYYCLPYRGGSPMPLQTNLYFEPP